jgi:hypothetical protein
VSRITLAGTAASAALALAAGCSSTPAANSPTTTTTVNASQDAKVTSCRPVSKIWLMTGSLHNSSSAARKYTMTIVFETEPGNNVVVSRTFSTGNIKAGVTTTFGASSGPTSATGVVCRISKVTATA